MRTILPAATVLSLGTRPLLLLMAAKRPPPASPSSPTSSPIRRSCAQPRATWRRTSPAPSHKATSYTARLSAPGCSSRRRVAANAAASRSAKRTCLVPGPSVEPVERPAGDRTDKICPEPGKRGAKVPDILSVRARCAAARMILKHSADLVQDVLHARAFQGGVTSQRMNATPHNRIPTNSNSQISA